MKIWMTCLLMTGTFAFVASAQAGDPAIGKEKAATCFACHGPEGISMNPIWPNLAGQKEQYIIKQLQDFQQGTRKNDMMNPISKTLSSTDIEHVAAYFASLRGPGACAQ